MLRRDKPNRSSPGFCWVRIHKQVRIEISNFIDDISPIYRISDYPKTILSTNYRMRGILRKC